jgi:hypothetical protein
MAGMGHCCEGAPPDAVHADIRDRDIRLGMGAAIAAIAAAIVAARGGR